MELEVYNGEVFERSKSRYVIFIIFFGLLILISIIKDNLMGAIILFMLIGGYFYYGIHLNKPITIKITDQGIEVGKYTIQWLNIKGYVIEIDSTKTEKDISEQIKNIVIITQNNHQIFTITDHFDNIKNFLINLDQIKPRLETYEQNFLEKLSRKLKL